MSAITALRAAHPRHTAKTLASELDCSHRQARRMLATGRIPQSLRDRALQLVERAIERNSGELARLRAELKAEAHAGMLARAEDRRAGTMGAISAAASRPVIGAELPLLARDGSDTEAP